MTRMTGQEQWHEVTLRHLQELGWLRRMLVREMRQMHKQVTQARDACGEGGGKSQNAAVAEWLRISQVHLKVMAEEQALLREMQSAQAGQAQGISDEDWALLQAALDKRNRQRAEGSEAAIGVLVEIDDRQGINHDA